MEDIKVFGVWYLVGFISFNATTYVLEKKISIRDFLFSLFFGLLGLFAVLLGAIVIVKKVFHKHKIKKILDKKII